MSKVPLATQKPGAENPGGTSNDLRHPSRQNTATEIWAIMVHQKPQKVVCPWQPSSASGYEFMGRAAVQIEVQQRQR